MIWRREGGPGAAVGRAEVARLQRGARQRAADGTRHGTDQDSAGRGNRDRKKRGAVSAAAAGAEGEDEDLVQSKPCPNHASIMTDTETIVCGNW